MMALGADVAEIGQELKNGDKRNARHPRNGSKGIALYHGGNNLGSFFRA
jgi:hypothetical protein